MRNFAGGGGSTSLTSIHNNSNNSNSNKVGGYNPSENNNGLLGSLYSLLGGSKTIDLPKKVNSINLHVSFPIKGIKNGNISIPKGVTIKDFKMIIERSLNIKSNILDDHTFYYDIGQTSKILITDDYYYENMTRSRKRIEQNKVLNFFRDSTNSEQDISDLYMTIDQLVYGKISIMEKTQSNVEDILSFEAIAMMDYKNYALNSKYYLNLALRNKGRRKIRGDGNCFFRSVIFSLLEKIIFDRDLGRLEILRAQLAKAKSVNRLTEMLEGKKLYTLIPDSIPRDQQPPHLYKIFSSEVDWALSKIDATIENFKGNSNDQGWETVEEFAYDINNSDRLDQILVLICRVLASDWFLNVPDNIDLPVHFACAFEENRITDRMDYIREYIMRWFNSAEGYFIQKGALAEKLKCNITIVLRTFKEVPNNKLLEDIVNIYNGEDKTGDVFCLLKPGHYDILYPY